MGTTENGAWVVGNEVGCALGTKIKQSKDVKNVGVKMAPLRARENRYR